MKLFKVYLLNKETDQMETTYRNVNKESDIYASTEYYEILKYEEVPKTKYSTDNLASAMINLGYKEEFAHLIVGLLEQYNETVVEETKRIPFKEWKWWSK